MEAEVDGAVHEDRHEAARETPAQLGRVAERARPVATLEVGGHVGLGRGLGGIPPPADGAPDGNREGQDHRHAGDAGLGGDLEVVVVGMVPDAALDRRLHVGAEGVQPRPEPGPEQRMIAHDAASLGAHREPRCEAHVPRVGRRALLHVAVGHHPADHRRAAADEQHEGQHRRRPAPAGRLPREDARSRHRESDEQRGDAAARTTRQVRHGHEERRARGHERRPQALLVDDQHGHPGPAAAHADPPPGLDRTDELPPDAACEGPRIHERERHDHLEPAREVVRVHERPRGAARGHRDARDPEHVAVARDLLDERESAEHRPAGDERQHEPAEHVGARGPPRIRDEHREDAEPDREAAELHPDGVRIEGERAPCAPAAGVGPAGQHGRVQTRGLRREHLQKRRRQGHRGREREHAERRECRDARRAERPVHAPTLAERDGEEPEHDQGRARGGQRLPSTEEERQAEDERLEGEQHPPRVAAHAEASGWGEVPGP